MLTTRHGLRGKPKKLARNASAPVSLFRLFLSPAFWGGASLNLFLISVQIPSDYDTESDSDYRAYAGGRGRIFQHQQLTLTACRTITKFNA